MKESHLQKEREQSMITYRIRNIAIPYPRTMPKKCEFWYNLNTVLTGWLIDKTLWLEIQHPQASTATEIKLSRPNYHERQLSGTKRFLIQAVGDKSKTDQPTVIRNRHKLWSIRGPSYSEYWTFMFLDPTKMNCHVLIVTKMYGFAIIYIRSIPFIRA